MAVPHQHAPRHLDPRSALEMERVCNRRMDHVTIVEGQSLEGGTNPTEQ